MRRSGQRGVGGRLRGAVRRLRGGRAGGAGGPAAEAQAAAPHHLHGGAARAAGEHLRQDALPRRGAPRTAGVAGRLEGGACRGMHFLQVIVS